MFAIGIILILAGAGSMFYGDLLKEQLLSNVTQRAENAWKQLTNLFSNDSTFFDVPGKIYVYAGAAAIVVGVILVVAFKNKR